MRWAAALPVLLFCLPKFPSTAQGPATDLLLERIKSKIAENQRRLPNYTCTATVERSTRARASAGFERVDALQLELALVQGKELLTWQDAGQFEEKELREFAQDGGFALRARSVF